MKTITWKAPEYEHRERTKDWYITVIIIVSAIAVTAVILGNILFSILILISLFALILFSIRSPEMLDIEISTAGIKVGKQVFTFENLEDFWIEEEKQRKKLLLKSKKLLMPLITIPVTPDVDTAELRNTLAEKINESLLEESFLVQIMDHYGF